MYIIWVRGSRIWSNTLSKHAVCQGSECLKITFLKEIMWTRGITTLCACVSLINFLNYIICLCAIWCKHNAIEGHLKFILFSIA